MSSDGPTVVTISPPSPLLVDEGEDAIIQCTADGKPEPSYTWKKGEKIIFEDSDILKLENADSETKGNDYFCVASNAYGEKVSDNYEVILVGKTTKKL